MKFKVTIIAIALIAFINVNAQEKGKEPTKPEETEIWKPKVPEVKTFGYGQPPSDAIVLFDGKNLDAWQHINDKRPAEWTLNGDGSMTVKDKSGDIETKQHFDCVQLHIEWRSNKNSKGSGQSKSNSGVWLQSKYEVQIVDSNDNPTYVNGQVGSVYKQSVPLAMASVPTGEWNAYDIIYHAPEFDSNGVKTKSATVTVLHNGVLIQDHFAILGTAEYIGWPKNPPHGKAPLKLQDHHDKSGVGFRNIWVRELH